MPRRYWITEVFSEAPFGGNPLATVMDAQGLSGDEMQRIARAFNLSETSFYTGGDAASGFGFRIFTPEAELPFAGHPTLGSAWLIRHLVGSGDDREVRLNLAVGPITVTFAPDGILWMRQRAPEFLETVAPGKVAASLGLRTADLDQRFPCQVVSTGIPFLVVPVVSGEALAAVSLSPGFHDHAMLVFAPGGCELHQQLTARVFVPALGVPEDPATGSANGCLAAYLSCQQYLGSDRVKVAVGQGYAVHRPSTLYLDAWADQASFAVNVGGRVRLVAEGQWLLA
ncbi:MAG: PhzF family phenazine biosynthesis protein [Pseudomonadota bacterium]